MKTFTLPQTDLVAPSVVLGLMRIAEKSDDEVRDLVRTARDAGIDFFDHADIYGPTYHASERRFAEALQLSPAERAQVTIQTKAGIVRGERAQYFDFSYDHLVTSAEESLKALGTDYLDVFLLHRPDALAEPEEVARAFDSLHSSGKVRHFGVSNHTPGQIEVLKTAVEQPLIVNQLQLSVTHAPIIAQGLAANMQGLSQSSDLDGGVLDYSRAHGMTVQAWSPQRASFSGGPILGNPDYPDLNAAIERLAGRYGVPPIAILTAWITRHPANIQVVLGSTNPSRVADAARGADVPLAREDWYELLAAAGYTIP